jgi:hypothetical protein
MAIPDDTPAPLTAGGLAAVKSRAGAGLFPHEGEIPAQHDGWDAWAAGSDDGEDRVALLTDGSGVTSRLARRWRRRRPPARPPTAG